jgi:hypothetical protein
VRVKKFSCTVVGLLGSKGQGAMGNDQDDLLVLPLATMQRRVVGTRASTPSWCRWTRADTDRLKASLGSCASAASSPKPTTTTSTCSTPQIADTLSGTTKMMTTLLGAVAAVSLLVGGIGIMNIMLVSVTERTREIGLRLAIGALEREVLLQFLIEAVVLAALGGLIGIAAGHRGLGPAGPADAGALRVPAGVNLLSFVFSAGIGVLFGYFPARRAAHGPDRGAAARIAAGAGARRIRGARESAPGRALRSLMPVACRPCTSCSCSPCNCMAAASRSLPDPVHSGGTCDGDSVVVRRSWPAPAPGGSQVPGSVGACASAPRRSAPPTRRAAGVVGRRAGLAARSCGRGRMRREAARVGQRPVQAVDVVLVLQVVRMAPGAVGIMADSRRTCAGVDAAHDVVGVSWSGCIRPAACNSSSACSVLAWNCATRGALSATTSARWRSGPAW